MSQCGNNNELALQYGGFCTMWPFVAKGLFLHSDWLKTSQLIPDQWNFISAMLNHIWFVFLFYHIIKDDERNFCQDFWQLKKPTRTWKYTRCIMQMSCLYASDSPFKNFCKIAQHTETIRKECLGKEKWRLLVVDKSTDHDKQYFNFYVFITISTSKKIFSFRARAKKGIARHIDASSVVGTW